VSSQRQSTARSRLVAAVTEEILSRNEPTAFPISSEHQLCRRFNVSRVTVRLALSDLENRGLIYRKHGKGTFAHGRATRIHRYLGILMMSTQTSEHRPMAEVVRGVQTVMSSLRSAVLLISSSPENWRPEKASSLGGVIIVPDGVTPKDIEIIRNRNLPFYVLAESDLSGPRVSLGQRAAARRLTEELLKAGHRRIALMTGYDACLDLPKLRGVHDALQEAGIDIASVPEVSVSSQEAGIYQAAQQILHMRPRPTAVIAFDDSFGSMLSFQARRKEGLQVPDDLSIVSFHDWPYLSCIEPALTTVRFDFFGAGQRAAECLSQAALTGQPVTDLNFEPCLRPGGTIGPVPANA
jgi:GntR family transcriptional regulator of arabinose operon